MHRRVWRPEDSAMRMTRFAATVAKLPQICGALIGEWDRLLGNLSFYKLSKKGKRFLPTQIAGLDRNDVGNPFLSNVYLRTHNNLGQGNRDVHHSGQVWIVEFVGMPDAFVWNEFQILS